MNRPPMLRRFLRTVGGHRPWVAATAAIASAAAVSGIGLLAFATVLISRSALLSSTASLALLIVAVRFFATTRVVLRYLERLVGHLGTFRLLTRIRTWFFASVIPIAPRGLTDRTTGQLLSGIIDDVDTMQDLYLRVLVPPVVAVATVGCAAVVIATIDPIATFALLAILLASTMLLVRLTRTRSRVGISAISRGRERTGSLVIESLDAARELTMFAARDQVLERSADGDRVTDLGRLELAAAGADADALAAFVAPAAAMTLLAIGIAALRTGSVPGEQLAMLPLVALASFEVLALLTASLDARDRSHGAAGRLLALADRGAERAGGDHAHPVSCAVLGEGSSHRSSGSPTGAIEVHGLTFATTGADRIGDEVSFAVPAGGVLVISGTSGAGKSTLVDLLLGFDDHDGTILVDGVDQRSLPSTVARGRFAAVRQQDHIFDTTIRDNLALAEPDATDEQLLEVLAIAGLDRDLAAMPEGLATRTGPDGDRLSGGERQRLLIARALLAERPILLLDEAFEHLDGPRRDQVLRSVLAHRRGRTTVLVTHDPIAIGSSTRHLRLHEGRVRSDPAPGTEDQR
ncbi:MAG: thiol reductant ABC exporter subunit CydC [Actinobacteria bacterium]|nr:thiol reductant ABC exporter subunit CydC [Actinomycetota bacterium]